MDIVVDGLQGHVFLRVVWLAYILGGDELFPGGVVVGIEQTLNGILDCIVHLLFRRTRRPPMVFEGGVDLVNIGHAIDPRAFLGVPTYSMSRCADAQIKLFVIFSSIR